MLFQNIFHNICIEEECKNDPRMAFISHPTDLEKGRNCESLCILSGILALDASSKLLMKTIYISTQPGFRGQVPHQLLHYCGQDFASLSSVNFITLSNKDALVHYLSHSPVSGSVPQTIIIENIGDFLNEINTSLTCYRLLCLFRDFAHYLSQKCTPIHALVHLYGKYATDDVLKIIQPADWQYLYNVSIIDSHQLVLMDSWRLRKLDVILPIEKHQFHVKVYEKKINSQSDESSAA